MYFVDINNRMTKCRSRYDLTLDDDMYDEYCMMDIMYDFF